MRPGIKRLAILPLAAILLAGLAAAADAPRVIVAEVRLVDFPLTIEALGTARANESLDVRPQVSEAITAIRFEEGQRVKAGHVLVELQDSEARADVAAAKAVLVESEGQYQRGAELYKTKAVSASALEQREAQRDADRAALDAAKARLAHTLVRAPFAGRVGLRRVSIGALVDSSTVITTLDDTDVIKLDFDVPETALSLVALDLPVEAHSAAWRDEVFRGRVSSIDTRVDPIARSVIVRALIPNDEERLRPGMFLSVRLMRDDVKALLIPEQAVVPEQSRQYVLVVTAPGEDGIGGIVEKREVRLGRRRPGEVEVLEGLAEGERVISEGTQKARPGEAVEIVGGLPIASSSAP
jgi:membrane fusion protein (multidrug efflux system)